MFPGMFGTPLAIPLQRCALALPQLLTAVTHTVDPAGITAGNVMLADVPAGVITAPGTEVLHVYVAAPFTAGTLKVPDPEGQT
jgi:hypothetical protein